MGRALNRRGALLVEFLGLPGVGKSELSRRVAGRLRGLALPVQEPSRALAHDIGRAARRARKSACVARELVLHPLAALRAACVLAASRQPSLACCGGLLFNWLLVSSLVRRARLQPGLHLIDEGPAQGAWSIALEGRLQPAVELLERLPAGLAPDLLVVVQASPEAVRGRLGSRAQHDSRLDSSLDTQSTLLQRGAEIMQPIQAAFGSLVASAEAPAVIVLGNEQPDDLDACAARLSALVEERLRARGLLDPRADRSPQRA